MCTKTISYITSRLYHCTGVGEGSEGPLEHHDTVLVQCEGDGLHGLHSGSHTLVSTSALLQL